MNTHKNFVIAARLSPVAIIIYQLLLIALIFLRPDIDPSWHSISEWAIGRYGWLMTTAFLISAVSYTCLLVVIKGEVSGKMGTTGIVLLIICIMGTFGVGIFTTDPIQMLAHPSPKGMLHILFGTSALILFPLAALIISLNIAATNKTWAPVKKLLRVISVVPLSGFLLFVIYTVIFVMPRGPHAYGPGVNIGFPPRVAFFTYMIWIIIMTNQYIQLKYKSVTQN